MPIVTSTNPGTTCVASQATPPAPGPPPTMSSSSTRCSNGEVQLAAPRTQSSPPSHQGLVPEVSVASASCARPLQIGTSTTTGQGLPVEARGDASCARAMPAAVAPASPPASRVDACAQRPGGLPANVIVR